MAWKASTSSVEEAKSSLATYYGVLTNRFRTPGIQRRGSGNQGIRLKEDSKSSTPRSYASGTSVLQMYGEYLSIDPSAAQAGGLEPLSVDPPLEGGDKGLPEQMHQVATFRHGSDIDDAKKIDEFSKGASPVSTQ